MTRRQSRVQYHGSGIFNKIGNSSCFLQLACTKCLYATSVAKPDPKKDVRINNDAEFVWPSSELYFHAGSAVVFCAFFATVVWKKLGL